MQFEGFDVQTLEEQSGISKHAFIPDPTETDVCLFCQSHESCVHNEPLIHTSGLHCKCRYFVHISCQATCAKKCEPDYDFICLFCNKPELKDDEEEVDEEFEEQIRQEEDKQFDAFCDMAFKLVLGFFAFGLTLVLYEIGYLIPLERFFRAYCSLFQVVLDDFTSGIDEWIDVLNKH